MSEIFELKRRLLSKKLEALYEEYMSILEQLKNTTSEGDRIRVKQQLANLEEEVLSLEKELNRHEVDITKSRESKVDSVESTIQRKKENAEYDVFLSYSRVDELEVEEIAKKLIKIGILPWFDRWELMPGSNWRDVLSNILANVKAVAIFIGNNQYGSWTELETRELLRNSIRRNLPVIPVILKNVDVVPQLPIFLREFNYVDFREDSDDALLNLSWGITGIKSASKPPL
jgi:hypothetical protein